MVGLLLRVKHPSSYSPVEVKKKETPPKQSPLERSMSLYEGVAEKISRTKKLPMLPGGWADAFRTLNSQGHYKDNAARGALLLVMVEVERHNIVKSIIGAIKKIRISAPGTGQYSDEWGNIQNFIELPAAPDIDFKAVVLEAAQFLSRVYYLAGKADLRQDGKLELAIKRLEVAGALDPEFSSIKRQLADAYRKQAIEIIKQAIEIIGKATGGSYGPEGSIETLVLGWKRFKGMAKPGGAEGEKINLVRELLEKAEPLYSEVINRKMLNAKALYGLALVKALNFNIQDAVELLKEAEAKWQMGGKEDLFYFKLSNSLFCLKSIQFYERQDGGE